MKDGYAFRTPEYGSEEYQILKKQFPSIHRNKQYGKVMFYLDDKADIAIKAFIENLNKKIISYQELQQIIDGFQAKISKKDKKKYLEK